MDFPFVSPRTPAGRSMGYNLYWGDLHNHCSVSYGEGTVQQALARARQQLDFCSVTGHAFWPDMPTDRARYGEIIDYHREGFSRLAGNWDQLLKEQAAACVRGSFIALPSYEWHSLAYGDHNVYAPGPELPLRDAGDLPALQRMMRESGTICVPHHIGYAAGYRGLDWRYFDEEVSPVVEIFSLHGCSVSEDDPYPMLHDMGPRDAGSTAEAGWAAGHKFGIIASTDHHGGYPGSYGEGRLAVLATELSREAIWDALRQRRVYAVTGDKIDARLTVNDAWIGNTVWAPDDRRLAVDVDGCDALDHVDLFKNGRVLKRWSADEFQLGDGGRYRLRISWGWGRKDEPVCWDAKLVLEDGSIETLETCFSGQAIVAPRGVGGHTQGGDAEDLPHEVTEQAARSCTWRSVTSGNISTRHATTQAVSLELVASLATRLILEVNGRKYEHTLAELLGAGRVHYLRGWLSEAIRIGPLVPKAECSLHDELTDKPEQSADFYRLRVAQRNGQMAWLTPIWAER